MKNCINRIKLFFFIAISFCLFFVLVGCKPATNEKKIGIIVPIEHKAINEIVAGFTESLRKQYPLPITFKIMNAQGDINLERAIIQQMKNEHVDLIVPIGTDATQMSASMITKQPILSLAASFTQKERNERKVCNIAVVHDEIPPTQLLQFIHHVYPTLTQLVLIHSTSEKIFPELTATIAAGKALGINIKAMMVPTLNELYSTANNIPANAQGIFVLKDNLIVSGMSTLVTIAEKRKIPLITSDQGSVQGGAAFALGVHEQEIGVQGAKLARSILLDKHACELPIVEMTHLTVFINPSALTKENQSLNAITNAANKEKIKVELINLENKRIL